MHKKIAFVFRPHNPNSVRIDTMPFLYNSIAKLAKAGFNIDVFVWEKKGIDYSNYFNERVNIVYNTDTKPGFLDKISATPRAEQLKKNYRKQFSSTKTYDAVVGVGQIGSSVAHMMCKNKIPLIIFNDEFPSTWDNSTGWEDDERNAIKNASLVVVPDINRVKPLMDDVGNYNARSFALPNIPTADDVIPEINWSIKLNIPHNQKMVLSAGTVADYTQTPEILTTVPYWPENYCLVLHERNKERLPFISRLYEHLYIPDKVFWTEGQYPENVLNSLIMYSSINVALYRNLGPNVEYMGFSSGKIMKSIALGVPVITSGFNSLKFISENKLGVNIVHPSDLSSAIKEIRDSGFNYKENCLRFYKEVAHFDNYWPAFYNAFLEVVN